MRLGWLRAAPPGGFRGAGEGRSGNSRKPREVGSGRGTLRYFVEVLDPEIFALLVAGGRNILALWDSRAGFCLFEGVFYSFGGFFIISFFCQKACWAVPAHQGLGATGPRGFEGISLRFRAAHAPRGRHCSSGAQHPGDGSRPVAPGAPRPSPAQVLESSYALGSLNPLPVVIAGSALLLPSSRAPCEPRAATVPRHG